MSAHQVLRMCGLNAATTGAWAYGHGTSYGARMPLVFAMHCGTHREAVAAAYILRRWTRSAIDDTSYNNALALWMYRFGMKENDDAD